MTGTVMWQRFESLVIFAAGVVLFRHWNHDFSWWGAVVLFFAPDLSFLGYLFGSKAGAFIYNAVHNYALGAALCATGVLTPQPLLTGLGQLWLAHAGFDRMLGYGLKSSEGFSFTHLGRIGKQGGQRDQAA